jgi:hypothetical protein
MACLSLPSGTTASELGVLGSLKFEFDHTVGMQVLDSERFLPVDGIACNDGSLIVSSDSPSNFLFTLEIRRFFD